MKLLDIEKWNRKEHFDFFLKYNNPFFSITSEVDCTLAYNNAKSKNLSFSAYYLYKSIAAINSVEQLKYRIQNQDVVIFDSVHVAATIGRKDGTFGFSFINFRNDFNEFNSELTKEIVEVEKSNGLRLNENGLRKDVIHYSILPWYKFTAVLHARNFNSDDSIPKIAIGKMFMQNDKKYLPISVDAHHGLVDGYHIGLFFKEFQKLMNEEL